MNRNKSIKERGEYWDAQIPDIKRMMIEGKRIRQIAEHYNSGENAMLSLLRRRGVSAIRVRYEHERGNI